MDGSEGGLDLDSTLPRQLEMVGGVGVEECQHHFLRHENGRGRETETEHVLMLCQQLPSSFLLASLSHGGSPLSLA